MIRLVKFYFHIEEANETIPIIASKNIIFNSFNGAKQYSQNFPVTYEDAIKAMILHCVIVQIRIRSWLLKFTIASLHGNSETRC